MMKYKIMTIAVASLLPLGFAASASADNTLTGGHQLEFTVVDARSISVAVKGAEDNTLDLGAVARTGVLALEKAVEVTFSTPGDDSIWVRVLDEEDGSAFNFTGTQMVLELKVNEESDVPDSAVSYAPRFNSDQLDQLYSTFNDSHVLESFDVDYKIETTNAALGKKSFFIEYRLTESS
jgi:hypothetical protein